MINCRDEDCNFEVILWTSSRYVASFCHSLTNSWSNKFSLSNSSHMCSILPNTFIKHLITILSQDLQLCLDQILFYTICPKISSKTRMPGKWGGTHRARPPVIRQWTRMPGKWGGARRARPPPLIRQCNFLACVLLVFWDCLTGQDNFKIRVTQCQIASIYFSVYFNFFVIHVLRKWRIFGGKAFVLLWVLPV